MAKFTYYGGMAVLAERSDGYKILFDPYICNSLCKDAAPGVGGKVAFDSIVPQMLGACMPDILIGVVVILVLSASMSTLSSLVITSSSTFTLDFVRTYCKDLSAKGLMLIIRAAKKTSWRSTPRPKPFMWRCAKRWWRKWKTPTPRSPSRTL